jgi:hypothetical protein
MALLAAGIALVAASASAQTGPLLLGSSVRASHTLRSNTTAMFTVRCPRGYVATSAGLVKPGSGTKVLSILPVSARTYRFRIGNPLANGDQRVTVVVACRKAAAGKASVKLRLTPLKTRHIVVPPRGAADAELVCPRGTTPADGAVDLDPARHKSLGASPGALALSVRGETTTLARLAFAVRNSGTRARTVAVYGGCVTLVRAAAAPSERFHVKVTTFVGVRLHPGEQTLIRRCQRGWFSLSAGYALRSRLTTVTGAAAVTGGGRWSLASDSDGDTKADLQLACARLAP